MALIVAHPILIFGQGKSPIKIGMHDPLTDTYAAEGGSEVRGLFEVNAKGGIAGRKVELIVEDGDANANAGLAARKAHKLSKRPAAR